eukprot:TRINITY_DN5442_c0_g1_i3.p1 TRINITY_DN5442_c0_g1~~TRINITY_DN5442_c0_g1_i3.p1  ORF type:complete len:367 (+),score=54.04 TRINITY_DN5442_c0_g1_i3:874-1974(+)
MTHYRIRTHAWDSEAEQPEEKETVAVAVDQNPDVRVFEVEAGLPPTQRVTWRTKERADEEAGAASSALPLPPSRGGRKQRRLQSESFQQTLHVSGNQVAGFLAGVFAVLILLFIILPGARLVGEHEQNASKDESKLSASGSSSTDEASSKSQLAGRNASSGAAISEKLPDAAWTLHSENHLEEAANRDCWSLSEKHLWYPASAEHTAPTKTFLEALRKYEKLHQSCVAGISAAQWEEHFMGGLPGYQHCKYLIWKEPKQGVGTRLMSLLSAFLYAMLTNRALLVQTTEDLPSLLCDPFPRSSWWLPPTFWPPALKVAPHQGEYVNGSTSNWVQEVRERERVKPLRWLLSPSAVGIPDTEELVQSKH